MNILNRMKHTLDFVSLSLHSFTHCMIQPLQNIRICSAPMNTEHTGLAIVSSLVGYGTSNFHIQFLKNGHLLLLLGTVIDKSTIQHITQVMKSSPAIIYIFYFVHSCGILVCFDKAWHLLAWISHLIYVPDVMIKSK